MNSPSLALILEGSCRLVYGQEDRNRSDDHTNHALAADQQSLRPYARRRKHPERGCVLKLDYPWAARSAGHFDIIVIPGRRGLGAAVVDFSRSESAALRVSIIKGQTSKTIDMNDPLLFSPSRLGNPGAL
jgi:hypothetical protein